MDMGVLLCQLSNKIMKKKLYILISLVVSILLWLVVDTYSFSPLQDKEFAILFPQRVDNIKRIYYKDFIGWSHHGDFLDYFIYQLDIVRIDYNYPIWDKEWEYVSLPEEIEKTRWLQSPIDSVVYSKFSLEFNEIDKLGTNSFIGKLKEIGNYYCYLYCNNLEKYFLLYSPTDKKLF